MKTKNILIVVAILLLGFSKVIAQDLITVDALVKEEKNPSLVILSAETDTEYNKVHIRNAVNVPYNALHKPGNIEGLLISPQEIAKILGDKGITENSMIVVYDEGSGRYAGRMYHTLKYMGAKNVMMLDGGLEAWKAQRKPITKNPTVVKVAKFNPTANNALMATIQDVNAAASNAKVALIDARAKGEFEGKEEGSKGHLPGAICIEYKEVLDAKGMFKPKVELEKFYSSKGITKDKTVILYCATGVRAGVHFLALTSILGYQNVKVYEGGYNEFVALEASKVVK
jgi:thiosulfate/3-mercaptopyruvate sulfurtransferase